MHAVVKGERRRYSIIRIFTLSTKTIVEDSNDEFLRITNVSMCNVCSEYSLLIYTLNVK